MKCLKGAPNIPVVTAQLRRRRPRQRTCKTRALGSAGSAVTCQGGESDRRAALQRYVSLVKPDVIAEFSQHAPPTVVEAMQSTCSNILGALPAQYFQVKVSSTAESLAQLMYSVLLTGYLFRNAFYRMQLRNSLAAGESYGTGSVSASFGQVLAEAAVSQAAQESDAYAPGTQKLNIEGEVLRWHVHNDTAERVPAAAYIEMLEREVAVLKRQATASEARISATADDSLLSYMKSLEQDHIQSLTRSASPDVLSAMNEFVHRLLGVCEADDLRSEHSESDAVELGRLLFWLMVVGYSLRQMEVCFDMSDVMETPSLGLRQLRGDSV